MPSYVFLPCTDALLTLVWFRLMYIPVQKSTQMEAFQKMDRFAQLFWPTLMNINAFQSGFLENLIVYLHGLWAYYQTVKMWLLIQLGWVVSYWTSEHVFTCWFKNNEQLLIEVKAGKCSCSFVQTQKQNLKKFILDKKKWNWESCFLCTWKIFIDLLIIDEQSWWNYFSKSFEVCFYCDPILFFRLIYALMLNCN
jgi:hypothetical protein